MSEDARHVLTAGAVLFGVLAFLGFMTFLVWFSETQRTERCRIEAGRPVVERRLDP